MAPLDATTWNPNTPNFHPSSCTIETCSLQYAYLLYDPNLAGNVLFLAIYSLLLPIQIGLGIWYQTWGVLFAMFFTLFLEIIGYVGRVGLSKNPFLKSPFLMYLVPLTIGPVFLAAAIYLCLSRIIMVYGERYARMKARTYTILFCCCDFVSLVIQATGGAKAAMAEDRAQINKGVHIMVAGLSIQVASLFLFILLTLEYFYRVYTLSPLSTPQKHTRLTSTLKFHFFLFSLALSTICVFTRSIFRVAELSDGFGGKLANDEVSYMLLEGAMIVLASTAMTILHPGIAFGREAWKEGDWSFGFGAGKRGGNGKREKEREAGSEGSGSGVVEK